jgi:hypothetical protein
MKLDSCSCWALSTTSLATEYFDLAPALSVQLLRRPPPPDPPPPPTFFSAGTGSQPNSHPKNFLALDGAGKDPRLRMYMLGSSAGFDFVLGREDPDGWDDADSGFLPVLWLTALFRLCKSTATTPTLARRNIRPLAGLVPLPPDAVDLERESIVVPIPVSCSH